MFRSRVVHAGLNRGIEIFEAVNSLIDLIGFSYKGSPQEVEGLRQ